MLPKGHSVCNRDCSSSTNVVVDCELEILQVDELLKREMEMPCPVHCGDVVTRGLEIDCFTGQQEQQGNCQCT